VNPPSRTGRLVTSAALILFFALASLSIENDVRTKFHDVVPKQGDPMKLRRRAGGSPSGRPAGDPSPPSTGDRSVNTALVQDLASHGYLVVTVDHTYSDDTGVVG
jgi:hypothetical protein